MSQTKAQLLDPVDLTIVTADLADDAVTAAKLASNSVVNASVDASAAIAGTKISPNFGSQNVATTGTLASGNLTITSTQPFLSLQDSNNENDFEVGNAGGTFRIRDVDAAANRLTITSAGLTTIAGTLELTSHLDMGDDDIIKLGNSDDFELFHQSSNGNSIIRETGGGILSLQTNGSAINLYNSTGAVAMATFTTGGSCAFKHGATTRLETTSGGASVTGDITGTGDLTIDTNTLHVDSSNNRVGIGTTSPSEELTIRSATPAIKLEDTDLSNSYIQLSAGDGDMFFSANDTAHNGQFFFRSGLSGTFTERARIDSGGNLGLGATITTARLDVARLGSSWTGQSPVGGTVAHFHNGNNNASSPAYLALGAGSSSISGVNFGDADDADVGKIHYSHSDNSLRITTNTGERLRINQDGDISIGLTSGARTPVHIHEPSSATTNVHITNTSSGSGSQDGLTIFMDGTSSAGLWYRENADFRFATNNNEKMRITSGGAIGIGTATPDGRFHLVTGGQTDEAHVTLHASATTGTDNDGEVLKVISSRGTGNNNAIFNVLTNTSTSVFAVTGAGNVGIGDATPDTNFKLDCTGAARIGNSTDGIIIENSTQNPNTANACRIHRNGSTGELNLTSGTTTARSMIFRTLTSGGESMRLTSGGSLGIGLSAPHRTLHQHVASSSANYHQFTNSTTGSGAGDGGLVGIDSNETLILWNIENDHLRFGTNNTERARISNDGKFMMGNTGSLEMGFGPQVLSIRGGNSAGYDGTAAAIFGQQDNDAATCIFYNSATNNGTNMLDTRCARGGHSGYSFAIYRSNSAGDTEFRLRGDGNAYADGSWNGGGADYAEYFEWADGNSSEEDRRGYTVVLDGNKIRKSTSSDSAATIIGVISGNPSIVGDNDIDNWKQKYQKDDYGSYILDSDGERILNSDWDETKKYVSREDRKEWSIVGLMGKIRIRKGQTMGTNWIKMQDISATVEEWLVR